MHGHTPPPTRGRANQRVRHTNAHSPRHSPSTQPPLARKRLNSPASHQPPSPRSGSSLASHQSPCRKGSGGRCDRARDPPHPHESRRHGTTRADSGERPNPPPRDTPKRREFQNPSPPRRPRPTLSPHRARPGTTAHRPRRREQRGGIDIVLEIPGDLPTFAAGRRPPAIRLVHAAILTSGDSQAAQRRRSSPLRERPLPRLPVLRMLFAKKRATSSFDTLPLATPSVSSSNSSSVARTS